MSEPSIQSEKDSTDKRVGSNRSARLHTWGLFLLMGQVYFAQGIADPTEGLATQPVWAMLKAAGHTVAIIAIFTSTLAIPWSIKPAYGFISDLLPIFGSRRRSYLVIGSALGAMGYLAAYALPSPGGQLTLLLGILLIPSLTIAFCDVVADGLMVEKGQLYGITGTLQATQWTAISVAKMVAGYVGGYLSQHGLERLGFVVCACAMFGTMFVVYLFVHDLPVPARTPSIATARSGPLTYVRQAFALSSLAMAAYLFLWSFLPCSSVVLYAYLTKYMNFSEQFFGTLGVINSFGGGLGALLYGFYCRHVPFHWIVRISIGIGVIANLLYLGVVSPVTAVAVAFLLGFVQMSGMMMVLDLAARVCSVRHAATTFALLMAVTNVSISVGNAMGGYFYQEISEAVGSLFAFSFLAVLGAVASAACWFLLPYLPDTGIHPRTHKQSLQENPPNGY